MIWVINFNHVVPVDVDFLHAGVIEIIREDAQPCHILINFFDQPVLLKLFPRENIHAVFENQRFQGFRCVRAAEGRGKLLGVLFSDHGAHIFKEFLIIDAAVFLGSLRHVCRCLQDGKVFICRYAHVVITPYSSLIALEYARPFLPDI